MRQAHAGLGYCLRRRLKEPLTLNQRFCRKIITLAGGLVALDTRAAAVVGAPSAQCALPASTIQSNQNLRMNVLPACARRAAPRDFLRDFQQDPLRKDRAKTLG